MPLNRISHFISWWDGFWMSKLLLRGVQQVGGKGSRERDGVLGVGSIHSDDVSSQ